MTQHKLAAVGTRRALKFLIPIALIVFVADQLTKVWAESALSVGDAPHRFIGEFIQLRLIYNPGAALSFGTNATAVLTLVSFAVAVGLIWIAPRLTSVSWVVIAGLLLGGSTGNLADRLFRDPGFPVGHVVDFIDYGPFIGNVADIAIVVAAVLIGLFSILGKVPLAEGTSAAQGDDDSSGLDPSRGNNTEQEGR
jgi:signal peptidase II